MADGVGWQKRYRKKGKEKGLSARMHGSCTVQYSTLAEAVAVDETRPHGLVCTILKALVPAILAMLGLYGTAQRCWNAA